MNGIDMASVLAAFLVEGRELVQALEDGLLSLDPGVEECDRENVNAMFRAAHTIKGSAGIVGLMGLGEFTHHVESLLDRVRDGEPLLDEACITRLLRCCDHIRLLIDAAEAGDTAGAALEEAGQALLATLSGTPVLAVAGGRAAEAEAPSAPPEAAAGFRLVASFGRDCLRDGLDPLAALRYLEHRSGGLHTVVLQDRVPVLDELQPLDCWFAFASRAQAGSETDAREAFEFFGGDCVVVVLPAHAAPEAVAAALAPLRAVLGHDLPPAWRDAGLLSPREWVGDTTDGGVSQAAGPSAATASSPVSLRTAEALPVVDAAAAGPAATAVTASSAPASSATAPGSARAARVVRVPADRLDELILQVGELVIAGAGVDILARQTRHARLNEAVEQLKALIDTIQSGTLQLRMVPIGETFGRFQRVVRDVAQELGKNVQLVVVGGDTELDKAMVERIGDPLMHLVRNALDHGMEMPADRLAAGKPAQGTLQLRACHESGSVVIEVSDDGRGLDRPRILAKAIERGVVAAGDKLSDTEIDQLIFEPGFSTAAAVTSLSGRGVGMDVVRQGVEALRGSIMLASQPGQGTRVQIRLPLTLAIIEGFMVGVGRERFILPLDSVVECVELPAEALDPAAPRYVNLRNELLPYVCLREAFGVDGRRPRRPSVVVVRTNGQKTGVLVDTLHGEIQTVIKPMNTIFGHLRAVSGTSVLGTGDIALILDLPQLVQASVDRALRAATLVN